jgi:hypothetical protein
VLLPFIWEPIDSIAVVVSAPRQAYPSWKHPKVVIPGYADEFKGEDVTNTDSGLAGGGAMPEVEQCVEKASALIWKFRHRTLPSEVDQCDSF